MPLIRVNCIRDAVISVADDFGSPGDSVYNWAHSALCNSVSPGRVSAFCHAFCPEGFAPLIVTDLWMTSYH